MLGVRVRPLGRLGPASLLLQLEQVKAAVAAFPDGRLQGQDVLQHGKAAGPQVMVQLLCRSRLELEGGSAARDQKGDPGGEASFADKIAEGVGHLDCASHFVHSQGGRHDDQVGFQGEGRGLGVERPRHVHQHELMVVPQGGQRSLRRGRGRHVPERDAMIGQADLPAGMIEAAAGSDSLVGVDDAEAVGRLASRVYLGQDAAQAQDAAALAGPALLGVEGDDHLGAMVFMRKGSLVLAVR